LSDDDVTLLFTGDMLVHNRISRKGAELAEGSDVEYDFNPMFDQVRAVVSAADLAICHQEVVLGVPGVPIGVFPALSAPAEFATAVAGAGYDGCSTASNHSTDYANVGVLTTIETLDEAGLLHTGTAAREDQSHGILYEVGGLTLGHLSFTYGVQVTRPQHPWSVGILRTEDILGDAELLKARGADFVVVSLHWGVQYSVATSGEQRRVADVLTASDDVDMIIGHHAHVLQGVNTVNGKLVAFGLGNFLSNQSAGYSGANTEDGATLMVRLRLVGGRWTISNTAYMPTWVHRKAGGYTIWPTIGPAPSDLSPRYQEQSTRRTLRNLRFDGQTKQGLSAQEAIVWLRSETMTLDRGTIRW
jgi:poly-gamma-glutamate synthesis protein (capsule biosynthesis protein)